MTEDEMVEWHRRFNGHKFEQTPRETIKDREAWCVAVHGVAKIRRNLTTEQQLSEAQS